MQDLYSAGESVSMKVSIVMRKDVVKSKSDISIKEAAIILQRRRIGSIVIVDDEDKCVGIVTERDIIRSIAHNMPLETRISRIMTANPITVGLDSSIAEVKAIMVNHRIRHVPVVDSENKVVGIISARDLLEGLMGIPTF